MKEKMYRPENWVETIIQIAQYHISTEIYDKRELEIARKFFVDGTEVGADAMLRALKRQPVPRDIQYAIQKMLAGDLPTDWNRPNGQVVFIPDEK